MVSEKELGFKIGNCLTFPVVPRGGGEESEKGSPPNLYSHYYEVVLHQ